jgi:uncharacterized delta-60 repeat protein
MSLPAVQGLEGRYLLSSIQLDGAFGTAGHAGVPVGGNSRFEDVLIQPDGKVLAAGRAAEVDGENTDALLVRYNRDGTLDDSFGSDGLLRFDLDAGSRETFNAIALGPNGTIIAGGNISRVRWVLARFRADGTLDTRFGGGDGVVTGLGQIDKVALQGDRIVVAEARGILRRHQADGRIDASFGTGGEKEIDDFFFSGEPSGDSEFGTLTDIAVFPGGAIAVVGGAEGYNEDEHYGPYPEVLILSPDGAPDTAFGGDGVVSDYFGGEDTASDVVIQPDGKLVVAVEGESSLLVRYTRDGQRDMTFGAPDGEGTVDTFTARNLALLTDGRIVLVGDAYDDPRAIVQRFDSTGAPDKSFSGDGQSVVDVIPDNGEFGLATAVAADGSIVVAGFSGDRDPFEDADVEGIVPQARQNALVARFLSEPPEEVPEPDPTTPPYPTVRLSKGVLWILGTSGMDRLRLDVDGDDLWVTSYEPTERYWNFKRADVGRIRAVLGDGDDRIDLSAINYRAIISGGAGDDSITGGSGKNTVFGDQGNDVLSGGQRDDLLDGGEGDDVLSGKAGNDTIFGGVGIDILDGGGGIDSLEGGRAPLRPALPGRE